jgi:hypothetical protein
MATQKQIEANRRNSQQSTGPRTAAGKAASRMNAMKSGIYAGTLVIRGENASELERLTAEYHQEFRPVTARERDLVDAMVRNEWIVRRMGLVEAELWGHHFQHTAATVPHNRFEVLDRNFPLGQAFGVLSGEFERLQRRVSALERSTRRALHELAELREQREQEDLAAAESATEPTSDPIGFVPSLVGQAPRPGRDPQVAPPTQADSSEDRAPSSPEPESPSPLIPAERSEAPIGFVPSINEGTLAEAAA